MGKPLFRYKNTDMYCMNTQPPRHGLRRMYMYYVGSRGEVALGCMKERAGHWQGSPSIHSTLLLPSLSGASPVILRGSSVGDPTPLHNCTGDGLTILVLLLLLPFPPSESGSASCTFCSISWSSSLSYQEVQQYFLFRDGAASK